MLLGPTFFIITVTTSTTVTAVRSVSLRPQRDSFYCPSHFERDRCEVLELLRLIRALIAILSIGRRPPGIEVTSGSRELCATSRWHQLVEVRVVDDESRIHVTLPG